MRPAKVGLAPLHAKYGWCRGVKMAMSDVRAERTGPTGTESVEWKMASEPGDAALDPLLVHDVGLVDAELRPGLRFAVVDLHDQGRAVEPVAVVRRAAR